MQKVSRICILIGWPTSMCCCEQNSVIPIGWPQQLIFLLQQHIYMQLDSGRFYWSAPAAYICLPAAHISTTMVGGFLLASASSRYFHSSSTYLCEIKVAPSYWMDQQHVLACKYVMLICKWSLCYLRIRNMCCWKGLQCNTLPESVCRAEKHQPVAPGGCEGARQPPQQVPVVAAPPLLSPPPDPWSNHKKRILAVNNIHS